MFGKKKKSKQTEKKKKKKQNSRAICQELVEPKIWV